jgi:hypothetical protein
MHLPCTTCLLHAHRGMQRPPLQNAVIFCCKAVTCCIAQCDVREHGPFVVSGHLLHRQTRNLLGDFSMSTPPLYCLLYCPLVLPAVLSCSEYDREALAVLGSEFEIDFVSLAYTRTR